MALGRRLLPVLLLLAGCGKGEVFGLGDPVDDPADAGLELTDALPGKDAEVDTGTTDALPDTGSAPDALPPDAWPGPDVGPAVDGGVIDPEDGGLPDPDGGAPNTDGGTPNTDGGVGPDAGPECLADNDCGFGGILGRCDPTTLTCVECYLDGHCGGQRVCDTNNGNVCRFPCFNGQCGPLGVCDPTGQFCVECAADTDCDPGEVCNPSTLECVECTTNADCALKPGRNICDVSNGECVGCITDNDCPTGEECLPQQGRVCAPANGRGLCVPCTLDDQCGGPDDLCIGYVGTGGLFDRACAIDCAANPNACPSGFECVSVRNGEMQCRPRYAMNTPTCAATRHLGAACDPDPQDLDPGCGYDGVQDARCETTPTGTTGQCVVWCTDNTDCAGGTTCQMGAGNDMVCR